MCLPVSLFFPASLCGGGAVKNDALLKTTCDDGVTARERQTLFCEFCLTMFDLKTMLITISSTFLVTPPLKLINLVMNY